MNIKPAKYLPRISFHIFAITAIVLAFAAPGFAYEEDTHFLMTYVICRSVGFTEQEALTVAAVDQGMDDSDDTASGVLARRDALYNDALNERDPRNRLIRFGIFFHFQQDTWAHRHHDDDATHLSRDKYITFNTPAGHAAWAGQPDRPPLDPVAAVMCLEDGIAYAWHFVEDGLGRQPNVFFKNYIPAGGRVDDAWTGKKKGKYFNQIDLAGIAAGSARMYLNSLVRAQIDAYPQSLSPNPHYFGRQTADQIGFEDARTALQKICDQFKSSVGTILIPTQQQKGSQGFTLMTTIDLLSLRPGSQFALQGKR